MNKPFLCKACHAELKTLLKQIKESLYFSCDKFSCVNRKIVKVEK